MMILTMIMTMSLFFVKNLPNIQCRFFHGEINLGSTGAFAQLTQRIGTNYIAYCDQDDIWEPDKLQLLYDYMCDNTVNMVCSDMYVIDQKSHVLSDSITTIRPHYFFITAITLLSICSLKILLLDVL